MNLSLKRFDLLSFVCIPSCLKNISKPSANIERFNPDFAFTLHPKFIFVSFALFVMFTIFKSSTHSMFLAYFYVKLMQVVITNVCLASCQEDNSKTPDWKNEIFLIRCVLLFYILFN
ncbi:MAG: hypothetical protein Q4E81_02765, partial [Succinatimonas sp.]|nr:hypothetical protein [Succinatimonas sp.]